MSSDVFEPSKELKILFNDHHLVAVQKPARIPVGSEDSGDITLLQMVRQWNAARQEDGKKGYCVPIHFLDRPVSGVILFGLSSKAAARLNELFRDRKLKKIYVAVTESIPQRPEAKLEHWLKKDKRSNVTSVSHAGDKEAKRCELSYRILATCGNRAMIEVLPITGRSHQIRAQMAAVGCPLVGDVKYGAKQGWGGLVALHAARLEMKHPVGGAPMVLRAPVPKYWQAVWECPWPQKEEGIIFDE